LLNPKVDNVPPTPVPPPTQTSTPVLRDSSTTTNGTWFHHQFSNQHHSRYQPPAQQAQQPQADCICHSDYAAAEVNPDKALRRSIARRSVCLLLLSGNAGKANTSQEDKTYSVFLNASLNNYLSTSFMRIKSPLPFLVYNRYMSVEYQSE
jgi:hypothetical protein